MLETGQTLKFSDLIFLIVYALVCIGIGLWSSRKQNEEDYLIAGRTLRTAGFIASVVASYIGGAAIVAYTAFVYEFGISAITLFLGTAVGFLMFIPYAMKIHDFSSEKRFHTLSDYYFFKFNKKAGVLSAIILLVVYFGMLLNQFIAGSSILSIISGWSYESSLFISGTVILFYLLAGGFSSVIKTDVFQYVVLILLFVLILILFKPSQAEAHMHLFSLEKMNPLMTVVFFVFGVFIVFQSAEYWQRVYAAGDKKVVRQGLRGSALLVIISGFVLSFVGLIAQHYVKDIPSSHAFAAGLQQLISDRWLGAGLVLIFAAIMSSADTIIFVLASSMAKDFSAADKKQIFPALMKKTRFFILLYGVAGMGLAFFFRDIIEVFKFITGLGFSIIPSLIGSFHFKLKSMAW